MNEMTTQAKPEAEVLSLVYELLDAHADTIAIGGELAAELRWQVHIDYLRVLQRKTREILARWYPTSETTEPK
jgi:hypothetical protein